MRYPEYDIDYHLRSTYGITLEQYNAMVATQKGRCAICNRPPPRHGRYRKLVVDHDHATGEVRSLLCNPCNTAMGSLGEDAGRCRAVADYIERWRMK